MDKLLHFGGAFCLLTLFYGAQLNINSFSLRLSSCFLIMICMVFGAEIIQYYRGRGFDNTDLLLGVFGSICASLVIFIYKQPR